MVSDDPPAYECLQHNALGDCIEAISANPPPLPATGAGMVTMFVIMAVLSLFGGHIIIRKR